MTFSRRDILKQSLASAGILLARETELGITFAAAPAERPKLPVAAVITVYFPHSHADVIVGKILEGFEQDGGPGPQLQLVSMYVDQTPESDMSRGLAAKHGFRIARSIDEALTLGSDKLAVAGVLSIGEHGDYPVTPDTGQVMYPRRRFFDEVAAVFRRTGQVVPVFNDKHLAYNWEDAKHMYDTARQMHIPFMAGSSIPVAWRQPPVAPELDSPIEEVFALGYSGLEIYGFHTLELLQCLVERRRGGETGVRAVQAVQRDKTWQTQREGRWSRELFEAALAAVPNVRPGTLEEGLNEQAALFLVEYRDGTRGTAALANGLSAEFAFAVKLKDRKEPLVSWVRLQDGPPYGHFGYLLKAMEHMFHTGEPAYPVERTLLTTGALDAAMHSVAEGQTRLETSHLEVAYQPADWPFAPGTPAPPRRT